MTSIFLVFYLGASIQGFKLSLIQSMYSSTHEAGSYNSGSSSGGLSGGGGGELRYSCSSLRDHS